MASALAGGADASVSVPHMRWRFHRAFFSVRYASPEALLTKLALRSR